MLLAKNYNNAFEFVEVFIQNFADSFRVKFYQENSILDDVNTM